MSHGYEISSGITRCVQLGLMCIPREYPHAAQGMQQSSDDARTPRALWPVFFGCYDWHSAVHNHWQLVRALRVTPQAAWTSDAVASLDEQLQPVNLAVEAAYLRRFAGFEMPYGIAWLHVLCAEVDLLSRASSPHAALAATWGASLAPLHQVACENALSYWRNLVMPNRAGAHANTAFAAGLMLDAARTHSSRHSTEIERAIVKYVHESVLHAPRIDSRLEPLGYDFISPSLCEADLARRVLDRDSFRAWIAPSIPQILLLQPPVPQRPEDGQQSHFDGLNISRAWMLRSIAAALPRNDPWVVQLRATADMHALAGLAGTSHQHYSGQHWLGSFAMYLLTLHSESSQA